MGVVNPAPWSRAWHAVLALVVLASLRTQVSLLLACGTDAGSGDAGVSVSYALVR